MINILLLFFIVSNSRITTLGNSGVAVSFSMATKRTREDFSFPEAVWLSHEGEPDLPSVVYKFGIPQDGGVEVNVVKGREEVIKDVEVPPVILVGIYEQPMTEKPKIRGEVYAQNRFFPENIVEVSQPGYFRDINTVEVRLNPIQYNPVTKELKISTNVKINITFKDKPKTKQIIDESFEKIYEEVIANYEQCKTWRREPTLNGQDPFAIGSWFKIKVDEEGIYRIGEDEIRDAGLDPQQFDPMTMKIYTARFDLLPQDVVSPFEDSLVEIPVYVEGEDDHSFDNDDYLIFYGCPANHFLPDTSTVTWFENGYALTNVYWFTFGGTNGRRMEIVDAAYSGATPNTVVTEILHVEEDLGNPTRSGINWYWQDISPGEGPGASGSMIIHHPDADGEAEVKVGIFTLHGGTYIYQLSFDGQVFFRDTLNAGIHNSWPPYYLIGNGEVSGDSSTLTIEIIRPLGTVGQLTAYLNAVDIHYERITDMSLPFHAFYETAQNYSIRCTNANSSPFVLDITDLNAPDMLDNMTVENNTMHLSSRADSVQLLYFSKYSLAKSAQLIEAFPGKLREPSSGCEYLFITHKNFSNAIMPLVDYRRNNYTTKVVIVDDIYDDFSFGKYDPLAIKRFLYYTTNNWTTVPTYVLLVGDATYDYKNNLGKESPPNFIPMYESGTTLSGNPGIPPNYIYEGEYVDFGAGETMILGRITARTNQEVRDFIDKVITYETGAIDGMWNKRIILAGDDEYSNSYGWEGPWLHSGACERMVSHIPDSLYDLAKVYMVSYPPFSYPTKKPNAQEAYIQELNKGGFIGIFFGHGNTHQLADEGLFYDTNIPEINNGRRYFFHYYGSCTVGRFDDSDFECIGEQLVRMKHGAIGTFAATAGTGCSQNEVIGRRLFDYMARPDTNLTMGESCFLAKGGYWNLHYLLIGDPAIKMRTIRNSMDLTVLPESLRPLEKLKVFSDAPRYFITAFARDSSSIKWFDETTADKLAGHVSRAVRDGPNLSDTVRFDYTIVGKAIYQGWWDNDTAQIIIPRISTTHLPVVKVSTFTKEKAGLHDSTRVYGTAIKTTDQEGPEVMLYDGARKLEDGDWVSKEFILTGKVSDASGINLLYSIDAQDARGFYLYVNDDKANKIDLRNRFLYDKNSYTSGEFNVMLDLPKAQDTITINVADNNNQRTVKTIILKAEIAGQISIENLLIYPNPLEDKKGLWFTFILTSAGSVTLKIYTIAGRLVKTIDGVWCGAGYNQIFWDALDDYQDEISNGVYLVKAIVEAETGNDKVVEKFIIAR